MRNGFVAVLAGAGMAASATGALAAEQMQIEKVQAAFDDWLAKQAPVEKVTGVVISFSDSICKFPGG